MYSQNFKSMDKEEAFDYLRLSVESQNEKSKKSALNFLINSYDDINDLRNDLKTPEWSELLTKDTNLSMKILDKVMDRVENADKLNCCKSHLTKTATDRVVFSKNECKYIKIVFLCLIIAYIPSIFMLWYKEKDLIIELTRHFLLHNFNRTFFN
ncbi:hypothetical protein M3Y97_00998100 [Aphelenchoides bicaudatus]|nr:hypothetical protein M3Y97_00998100 [Aphelenchoides bicaudatus]